MWKLNFIILLLAVIFYCFTSDFFALVDPISYSANLPDKFDGILKPNEKLDKAERLFEDVLHWPESFAVHSGKIYTGLGDGRIVRIIDDKMETVCRTGKDCAGQHEEHICGRPLGLEFDTKGLLYVVDAYHGLFTVDVKTGKKTNILPSSTVVDGHPLKFLNDLVIDEKEQTIYLTQSSTKWDIGMVLMSILEHDSSGRLLKYNLKTKRVETLLTNLSFPNGVVFSNDGLGLVIAEGNKNKLFKYFLRGEKKDLYTDFSEALPGEPDNISKNKRGNYWVGLSTARSREFPALHDRFDQQPLLRKAFIYIYKLIAAPIAKIMSLVPDKRINEIGFELSTGRILADLPFDVYGMILEVDDKGRIVQTLQSPSGRVAKVSEVLEMDGYLYLGSWRNRYLGRISLTRVVE